MSDIERLTEDGVDMIWNKVVKMPRKVSYPQICTEIKQPKKIGNYDTMGDIGPAGVKPEGDSVNFDSVEQNLRTNIESFTIAKAVQATREKLEYDLYNVINRSFGTPLMRVMLTYKERAIAAQYNDAFTTTGADGVAVVAATHPLQRSDKVNDNLATGALTPDNLILAKNKFNAIYDQAGDFFDTEPTHLLIHPNKIFQAIAILESQLMAFELSNTKNVTQAAMPIKIVTNKYLDYNDSTSESPWFLLDRSYPDAGCILQTKSGLQLKTWWVNENQVFRGLAFEMYGEGVVAPGYGIVGSTGA